jgi:2,3-bisphosphoglycerate-independent phosphoglycerate mutase
MKYAIVLPDGASDERLEALGGRTPLEASVHPHLDWIAANGRLGRVVTIPEGFTPGTDVGTLSLFGYDPHVYYSGRAPLEAAAKGLKTRPDQMIFRCNFVTVLDGRMKDNTGGHITQEEADALIAALAPVLSGEGCELHTGVTYRNLLLLSNAETMKIKCAPPHDIIDQPVDAHAPTGDGAERVLKIQAMAAGVIAEHPVNARRRERGAAPVTGIWLWGQGRPVPFESFASRFGPTAAVITAVDILRGLGTLMGMKLIEVPGATGFIDTDYDAKGARAVRAVDEVDMIIVHVEAADEAAHMGSADEKVKALSRIDEAVVGPLLARLRREKDWRILVAADHATLTRTRGHSSIPPLFAYAGSDVAAAGEGGRILPRLFTEPAAEATGDHLAEEHRLMGEFLRTG